MRLLATLPLLIGLAACGDSPLTSNAPVATPQPPATPAPAPTPVPVPVPAPVAKVCESYSGPEISTLKAYEGLMHEHSSYSDGDPVSIPADYFRIADLSSYSFVGSSEHSDSLDAGNFLALHASCTPGDDAFDPESVEYCFLNPTADNLVKWASTATQAGNASNDHFLAIRGFEWTSDVFGHINVYFSTNFTNAKTDGGYALTMDTFWDWFTRDPATPGAGGSATSTVINGGAGVPFGGGGDGLAHFNHPHDKCQTKNDPSGATAGLCDWNDYEYIPAAAERMFGMELYNDGNRDDRYESYYARALDKGWHLAPIGSEDEHFGKYGVEEHPKTVTLAQGLGTDDFKAAWLARRTYALSPGQHLRATLTADQVHPMGSTLTCAAGKSVPLDVAMMQKDGSAYVGEYRLFSNGGEQIAVVKGATAHFELPVPAAGEPERWYYVRVHGGAENKSVAYLAPVWIKAK